MIIICKQLYRQVIETNDNYLETIIAQSIYFYQNIICSHTFSIIPVLY